MMNVEQTIISQYGNSSAIGKLIHTFNDCIDPSTDIDNFYSFVWNVETAQGFGLDIWGRIVGVQRDIFVNPVFSLDDTAFRSLILLKALSNISASDAPSINKLLTNWMTGRGRCYVTDLGEMRMSYVFEFVLQPFELQIITQGGIFLRPAGVKARVIATNFPVFGFREGGTRAYTGFNQAPFISEDSIHAVS
jgi:hypothetical protein